MSQRSEQLSLLSAFLEAGVEYAVVGGVAVNAHGFVRNTRDLDIFIRPTEENAKAAFRALSSLGAPLEGLNYTDLLTDYAHYQLQATHTRVDLLTSIGNMSFEQVWRNRVDAEIDGITIHFISKEDLIENKRQIGRSIDIADAEQLSLVQGIGDLQLMNIDRDVQDTCEQPGASWNKSGAQISAPSNFVSSELNQNDIDATLSGTSVPSTLSQSVGWKEYKAGDFLFTEANDKIVRHELQGRQRGDFELNEAETGEDLGYSGESIAVRLTEEQVRLLLSAEYPNDGRMQTTALAAIYSGDHVVNIMEESVELDYSEDQKTFFAILEQEEKPALDAKLTQLQTDRARENAQLNRTQEHRRERSLERSHESKR